MTNVLSKLWRIISTCILIFIIFAPVLLQAQDEFDFGDSFELVEDSSKVLQEENIEKDFWSAIPIRGKFCLNSNRQISKSDSRWIENGPAFYTIVDYYSNIGKFYFDGNIRWNSIYRIENFSGKTRDKYEIETVIRELYYKKSFRNFTLTLGNEIINWSKLDFLPKIDRISAIDQSKYFFADPEDILLGQNNIRLDYYKNQNVFSLVFVPFPRVNRFTEGYHPYSVIPGISIEKNVIDLNPEFHCRYAVENENYSITFLTGITNNRSPVFELFSSGNNNEIQSLYDNYSYAGYSVSAACAPFLLKNELVFDYQMPVQLVQDNVPLGITEIDRLNLGIGYDYNLGSLGTLINEYLLEYVTGNPAQYTGRTSSFHVAGGWTAQFLNDRLDFSIVNQFSNSIKNLILRVDVGYDINNSTKISGKFTGFSFGKGKNDYQSIEDYDLIALSLEFSF